MHTHDTVFKQAHNGSVISKGLSLSNIVTFTNQKERDKRENERERARASESEKSWQSERETTSEDDSIGYCGSP